MPRFLIVKKPESVTLHPASRAVQRSSGRSILSKAYFKIAYPSLECDMGIDGHDEQTSGTKSCYSQMEQERAVVL